MSTFWSVWSALLSLFCLAFMFGVIYYYWRINDKGDPDKVVGEFDGIEERDAPAPQIMFYAYAVALIISMFYLVFYPGFGSWPGLTRWTPESRVLEHEVSLKEQVDAAFAENGVKGLGGLTQYKDIVDAGGRLYETHCIACHRTAGRGQRHYPALNDEESLYGNDDANVLASIIQGRHGVMAGWEEVLTKEEISQVATYVISLDKHRYVAASNTEKFLGSKVYAKHCTDCHNLAGDADRSRGIPSLKDKYWLHGGDRKDVKHTVKNGLSNVMPAFDHLKEEEVFALGAYLAHLRKEEAQRLGKLDPELVEKGTYLAAAGDCVACHISHNGEPWGGGLPFLTPFGTIYATNISTHVEEGIGSYTYEDFDSAIRRGYNNKSLWSRWLYPAMPFTSYTYLTDEDMRALWEWSRSLPPVSKPNRSNKMMFPANIRLGLMGWNFLFLDRGELEYDESRSEKWRRGKYLVRGFGHCWECHTPRNIAQALDRKKVFQGNYIDGWNALNITANELRLAGWTVDIMTDYLHTGKSAKGTPFGGMAEVVEHSLSKMTREDIEAISVYLLEGDEYNELDPNIVPLEPKGFTAEAQKDPSYAVFQYTCAACHGPDGKGREGIAPALLGNGVIMHSSPFNTIAISIRGLEPDYRDEGAVFMPMSSFDGVINDEVIAKLMTFVRKYLGGRDETVSEKDVVDIRNVLKKGGYLNKIHQVED
tara:strand:+ start:10124 stop:12241 length:2118 start_codon:yes stop_codon:yes gene_type:complete